MKFIFPQNYKFKNKLFGIVDYTTAIADLIWIIIIYFFSNIFFSKIEIKLFIFGLLTFPVFLISIIGFNHESIFSVAKYIIKFLKNRKIYLYK